MANNGIKYNSSGSENNALNKGNWWIGTGDVSKHPTSSTGFWSTITPNGYAIYSYKPNDGPSIHILNTDDKLIEFTNRFYNKSFTTVEECLEYYANEPDLLCQTNDFESIITDGLILYLDARNVSSYPKRGTTWFDLSNNSNNGNLVNSPTYLNDNDGVLEFDGVDDYVDTGKSASELGIDGSKTKSVSSWVYTKSFNQGGIWEVGSYDDGNEFSLRTQNSDNEWRGQFWGSADIDFIYDSLNKWVHFVVTWDGTTTKIYADASKVGSADNSLNTKNGNTFKIGKWRSDNFNGLIANVQIYDRALSEEEIRQNYNVTKYKELVYDFRNGEFDNDWVINNFYILSDTSYSGSYSAGSDNQGTVNADLKPKDLVGGKNVYSIEYYWWEDNSQTGHVVDFVDNNGNLVLRSGTENPQWNVTDAAGKDQIYGGDNYNEWTYYHFTFNWNDGTYDYYMKDTLSGTVKTGNRTLNNNTNIEKIHIDGNPYGTGDECRFDNIRIKLNRFN